MVQICPLALYLSTSVFKQDKHWFSVPAYWTGFCHIKYNAKKHA